MVPSIGAAWHRLAQRCTLAHPPTEAPIQPTFLSAQPRACLLALSLGVGAVTVTAPLRAQEAVASAIGASAPASAPTQHRDALNLLRLWLEAQVAYDRVPGLFAGVVIGQDLVWSQAWGSLDHRRRVPTQADTLYSICSISKLFTSVAVMQQWEVGKFSLDEDIGKWLPGFAIQRSDADSGPISVRSVLMHASGLPRESDHPYWTGPDFQFPNRAELMQRLAGQRTLWRASDRYQYSNLGMALLGELVAQSAGMSYADYVQQRIQAPLKMADTRPGLPLALSGTRLAQGHGALRRDGTRETLPNFDTQALAPAAGFTSNVPDLARFAAWQFRLHKAGGQEVLRASTLREMQRVQWTNPDGKASWGLGFAVGREGANTLIGHTGVCPGHLAALSMAMKDEVAVIGLANANDNQSLARYTRPMRQIMLKGLRLRPARSGPGSPDLAAYAGRYDGQPWTSETVLAPWGEGLAQLSMPNADPATGLDMLRHVGADRFRYVREDGSLGHEIAFERDTAGQVRGLRSGGQFLRKLD